MTSSLFNTESISPTLNTTPQKTTPTNELKSKLARCLFWEREEGRSERRSDERTPRSDLRDVLREGHRKRNEERTERETKRSRSQSAPRRTRSVPWRSDRRSERKTRERTKRDSMKAIPRESLRGNPKKRIKKLVYYFIFRVFLDVFRSHTQHSPISKHTLILQSSSTQTTPNA